MSRRPFLRLVMVLVMLTLASATFHVRAAEHPAQDPPNAVAESAKEALRRAIAFWDERVATEGGSLWLYSADLDKREGEGRVEARTAWVQPPGTPFVGEALLDVWLATKEPAALAACRRAADVLIRGQLRSGGWTYRVELDPQTRRRYAYRVDGEPAARARDVSTLDDDTTQAAIRFLARLDGATGFHDERLHASVASALASVLAAQFANGAWPQGYRGPVDRDRHEVRRARYAEGGEYPRVKEYWELYTLNDGLVETLTRTLLLAAEIYEDDRYLEAAKRGGAFLILAQMPEPQPAWAQQYDFAMRPAWARKFEPPAISGGESQGVLDTLLDLYEATGERRFLEPVAPAIAYFRRSRLPDGRLARFYELETNRPLYFTRSYELTYADDDLPTHYAFKVPSRIDAIDRRHRDLVSKPWTRRAPKERTSAPPTTAAVERLIAELDDRGAWVDDGRLRYHGDDDVTREVIDPRTFVRNVRTLARFIEASSPAAPSTPEEPRR